MIGRVIAEVLICLKVSFYCTREGFWLSYAKYAFVRFLQYWPHFLLHDPLLQHKFFTLATSVSLRKCHPFQRSLYASMFSGAAFSWTSIGWAWVFISGRVCRSQRSWAAVPEGRMNVSSQPTQFYSIPSVSECVSQSLVRQTAGHQVF